MPRGRIGIIGTGAIAAKHAEAWRNIGCAVTVCSNRTESRGSSFAESWGARFVRDPAELCFSSDVDLVDVCAFPDYRIEPVSACAEAGKPVQLQKPIATNLGDARRVAEIARNAGITVGVVSQHRFDNASIALKQALEQGRLGRLLQCDAYVKWYRPPAYYARAFKGTWQTEGGGALINQAIHQVDLLRWFAGPVARVYGRWLLGAVHRIESEDVVNATLQFASGALGVIEASTALWPGYAERMELHGAKGSVTITGDRLTSWEIQGETPDGGAVSDAMASGASDPMAISLVPFERQFRDLLEADAAGREPLVSAQDGIHALEIVEAIYESCRTGQPVEWT